MLFRSSQVCVEIFEMLGNVFYTNQDCAIQNVQKIAVWVGPQLSVQTRSTSTRHARGRQQTGMIENFGTRMHRLVTPITLIFRIRKQMCRSAAADRKLLNHKFPHLQFQISACLPIYATGIYSQDMITQQFPQSSLHLLSDGFHE